MLCKADAMERCSITNLTRFDALLSLSQVRGAAAGMQMKQGAEQRRRRLLKKVRVVGLTCCSAMLPVMDGLSFDTVVLDECSQMTEPLSAVPLVRSQHCRWSNLCRSDG